MQADDFCLSHKKPHIIIGLRIFVSSFVIIIKHFFLILIATTAKIGFNGWGEI
ncbi:MAG: hypothetical protein ACXWE6_12455 [Nitrososphaeraceae archaeon]